MGNPATLYRRPFKFLPGLVARPETTAEFTGSARVAAVIEGGAAAVAGAITAFW